MNYLFGPHLSERLRKCEDDSARFISLTTVFVVIMEWKYDFTA